MHEPQSSKATRRLSAQLLTALIPTILLSVGMVSLIAIVQLSVVASGRQVLTFGLLAATVLVISLGAIVSMTFRFSRRLRLLGEAAHRAAQGEPVAAGDDIAELGDLIEMIQKLANQLAETTQDVENRVRDRTRDLAITSEIGRIATSLRDIDLLLSETVEQIRSRFDVIYHAQIFLLDDVGQFAVLVASTGEAGKTLLAAGHRLQVGSDFVIGRVTARKQTVIASDTRKGEVPWRPNPLLPNTRAEMAVPLTIEDRVIGALDVQSVLLDVFTPEMIQVFKVLSDQLAIAIENARLLSELEKRVREIDVLNRQLTRSAWQEFLESRPGSQGGYVYDWRKIKALDRSKGPKLIPNQTEVPIQVRGETIGTLIAALDQDTDISADDQVLIEAVAERVALAIENARLFEQTQRALAETERLYETSRAVTSTPDLETIYGLVVEQLNTVSYVDRIELLLSGPDPVLAQYLESVYTWNRQSPADPLPDRVRLAPPDPLEEPTLPSDRPMLISRVSRDLPANHPLSGRLKAHHARSAVLVPLNAGGRWFGMLVCSSQRTGAFDMAYVNFASALSDQLAITIENRRLFDEAQSEARRARALAEAGQLASQIGGDYETGLHNLFQAVAGPGHYNRWWFGLLTDNGTALRQVTASHPDLPDLIQMQEGRNALAEAARIEEIVLVNDPADHPVVADMSADEVNLWGKYIAMPVKIGAEMVGVLMVGRGLDEPNLDERDIQLAATLTSQVAVATENRRLFEQAESERQNLQTIVDTMPTGILVMNANGEVLLSNESLQNLLGLKPGPSQDSTLYPILRADLRQPYPREEWPLSQVFSSGAPAFVDDMLICYPRARRFRYWHTLRPFVTATVTFPPSSERFRISRSCKNWNRRCKAVCAKPRCFMKPAARLQARRRWVSFCKQP